MMRLEYFMEFLGHTDLATTRKWCKQFEIEIENSYGIEMVDLEKVFKLPQFQDGEETQF